MVRIYRTGQREELKENKNFHCLLNYLNCNLVECKVVTVNLYTRTTSSVTCHKFERISNTTLK
uniref:Uncharacterized protein n=1 Tax=Glossina pallidipes TaxID=7398 RepID=A0A1A9ZWI7_GLOPL